jgi:glycosidase
VRNVRQGGWGIMEEARLPMLWGEAQNRDLFSFYQRLIALRKEAVSLRTGTRSAWLVDRSTGRYGYLRRSSTETLAIALNVSAEAQHIDLPGSVTWKDAFTGDAISNRVSVEPYGFVLARQS